VAVNLIVGIAVLALLIYRQLVARPVSSSGPRIGLILGVIGLVETIEFLHQHHQGTEAVAALAGSLVLALAFGVARARTVRLWLQDGAAWRQGNLLTAGLWILALGAHLGYDALLDAHQGTAGLGSATILLYLAVTFTVQRVIVAQRASRLGGNGSAAPFFGAGPARGTRGR
jgi:hypothetical protein